MTLGVGKTKLEAASYVADFFPKKNISIKRCSKAVYDSFSGGPLYTGLEFKMENGIAVTVKEYTDNRYKEFI